MLRTSFSTKSVSEEHSQNRDSYVSLGRTCHYEEHSVEESEKKVVSLQLINSERHESERHQEGH